MASYSMGATYAVRARMNAATIRSPNYGPWLTNGGSLQDEVGSGTLRS